MLREAVGRDDERREVSDLAGLDEQLTVAARRVVTERSDGLADLYRAEVQKIQQQRDAQAAELDRRRMALSGLADPDALVDAAVAIVGRFEAAAERPTPAELWTILRDHVERVESRFTHDSTDKKTRSSFLEGTVFLREDSPLSSCLVSSGERRWSPR